MDGNPTTPTLVIREMREYFVLALKFNSYVLGKRWH